MQRIYSFLFPHPIRRMVSIVVIMIMMKGFGASCALAQAPPTPASKWMVPVTVENGDTIPYIRLRPVYVFAPLVFSSEAERLKYLRLVRDVKVVLPFAKIVSSTLIETYKYIETLPTEKEREAHLKRMEKDLYKQYKPQLKKLTWRQGQLLLKLIDRECNSSSYQLIDAFLGSFSAHVWNAFAGLFGANLKTTYDPNGADALTERVVMLVQYNMI